ncbi:unnamed protein product [Soboliphyme baturini]|uniref:Saposin B-type domain-containing protein n=1 Tax=Soboliphyme baturini TaxID=241478 RepID=A0A183IXD4_9BILA|nr:unnamed protein product [Soboliphyme baturini]
MNCLSQQLADVRTFQMIENEQDTDYLRHIRRCFSAGEAEGSRQNKCVLDQATLNQNVLGPNGPLRGCKFCINLANDLHNKYMKSSASDRMCFRKHLSDGIISEMQPCIQNRLHDYRFRVPNLPDFDTAADSSMSIVVTPSCTSRFQKVEAATCQCFRDKQAELVSKMHRVRDVLMTAQSTSQCEEGIEAAIGPWVKKVMKAMKDCSSSGTANILQKIPPNKVIKVGCMKIVSLKGSGRKQIEIGFRFIDYFLDALHVRLIKFCQCS